MTRKTADKIGIHRDAPAWVSLDQMIDSLSALPNYNLVSGIISFSANIKDVTMDGHPQVALSVDVQDKTLALGRMEEIAKDAEQDPLVHSVSLNKNEGLLKPGDDLGHILIASPYASTRLRDVFTVLEHIVNRLKRETKIRFKEHTPTGAAYYQPKDPTKTYD